MKNLVTTKPPSSGFEKLVTAILLHSPLENSLANITPLAFSNLAIVADTVCIFPTGVVLLVMLLPDYLVV
ncbi:MAG: hypothetical protein KME05_02920 [Gloeocapsa sp. UFS-A4-WI-NPMV-4B04]|nr:hypothetical protein [Gloeocapsa sp. UFS-A4-WI-NPMV-4B04]